MKKQTVKVVFIDDSAKIFDNIEYSNIGDEFSLNLEKPFVELENSFGEKTIIPFENIKMITIT